MKKIYVLDTHLNETDDVALMLEENMIAIPYGETGDLQDQPISTMLQQLMKHQVVTDEQLEEVIQVLDIFVHGMCDGDWVLIGRGESVYLGDVGTYFYNTTAPSADKGWHHQRGVTWFARLSEQQLPVGLGTVLAEGRRLTAYTCTDQELAHLERLAFNRESAVNSDLAQHEHAVSTIVPDALIKEALAVLSEALRCEDPHRREQAAIAILQYAKSGQ